MDAKGTLLLRSPQKDNTQHLYKEKYNLLHCYYSLSKNTNENGQIIDDIRSGDITVVLPIFPNNDLLGWLFDSQRKYNGEISINNGLNASLEKIYFEEGRPIKFRFHYEPTDTTNVLLMLTINVQRLIIGEAEYINNRR